MATITEPETIPWGQGIRVINTEVAAFFYNRPGWAALEDVQKWAEENNGRVESAHGILKQRSREQLDGHSWNNWLTPNYEEDAGIDYEGRFGKIGRAVFVAIQGGGIMLSSPQRLQEAYTNRTLNGKPYLRQGEIGQVLAGILPSGQQIRVYTLKQLAKEDPEKLPQTYSIAVPLEELEDTPSGIINVDKLQRDKLFIVRAGHPQTAANLAETLTGAGVRKYGNWHRLKQTDPNKPSGRVLRVGGRYYGLDADDDLDSVARFVGVSASGAEGAAAKDLEGTVRLLEGLVDPARIPELMQRLGTAGYR